MKNLLLVIFMLISMISFSQNFHYDKFFGYTVDSATRKTLDSVKIIAKDSHEKVLYEKFSDIRGYFELNTDIDKIFTISFIHPSFMTDIVGMTRTVFGLKSFDTVFLVPKVNILKPVVVISTKPTIRQELDSVIYDVQSDYTFFLNKVYNFFRPLPSGLSD